MITILELLIVVILKVFTKEEEEKLSVSLGLSKEQTKHLVSTVQHIMQQVCSSNNG